MVPRVAPLVVWACNREKGRGGKRTGDTHTCVYTCTALINVFPSWRYLTLRSRALFSTHPPSPNVRGAQLVPPPARAAELDVCVCVCVVLLFAYFPAFAQFKSEDGYDGPGRSGTGSMIGGYQVLGKVQLADGKLGRRSPPRNALLGKRLVLISCCAHTSAMMGSNPTAPFLFLCRRKKIP